VKLREFDEYLAAKGPEPPEAVKLDPVGRRSRGGRGGNETIRVITWVIGALVIALALFIASPAIVGRFSPPTVTPTEQVSVVISETVTPESPATLPAAVTDTPTAPSAGEPTCLQDILAPVPEERIVRVPYNSSDNQLSVTANGSEETLGIYGARLEDGDTLLGAMVFEVFPNWEIQDSTKISMSSFLDFVCENVVLRDLDNGGNFIEKGQPIMNFRRLAIELGDRQFLIRIKVGTLDPNRREIKIDFLPPRE
jgi:hypothetical protein